LRAASVPAIDRENKCAAFVDSFSNYGQFRVSKSGMGHIMYSTATARSTMDYSTMPVDDGVVNSPPNRKKCTNPMNSPSPLKCCCRSTSPEVQFGMHVETQRKLYNEQVDVLSTLEV